MSNNKVENIKDGDFFYKLDSKISYGRSPIKIEAIIEYDTLKNITKESPLVKENTFNVVSGTKWFDFLPFNNSFDYAISEKVKNTLEANGITGIWYFPIIIENYPDKIYYCFAITSIAGKILNLKRLNNFEDDYIDFDTKTWDGSDIFNLDETGIIACTKKVKDILTKHKFTNVEIENL
jgi:hypothetical protein